MIHIKLKKILPIIISIIILGTTPITNYNNYLLTYETEFGLHAKNIVTIHRRHKGRYQHRRWNKTTRQWVDAEWIDDD